MTSALHIELTSPQTVNGKRAPYQSLWLLVRLYYAQRFEAAARVIRLAELRQQFTDARSLRMFISRAFKDFARWGVQVGWGEDAGGDPASMRPEALRWLLLSEWLCGCAGLNGQSAWNAIYLMRIARGDATHGPRLSLTEFRALRPLQPAEITGQAGELPRFDSAPLLPSSWRTLAEQLLARQRQGESRYSALQRCGLWLEHAWYAAHEGDLPAAARSLANLLEELPHLPASDKAFFDAARRRFPVEFFTDTSR